MTTPFAGQLTNGLHITVERIRRSFAWTATSIVPVTNGTATITGQSRQPNGQRRGEVSRRWTNRLSGVSAIMSSRCWRKTGCSSGRLPRRGRRPERIQAFPARIRQRRRLLALTRHALGRRIVPSDPGRSLLLLKPTAVPHKGGQKFEIDSLEYRVLSEWIAAGTRAQETKIRAFNESKFFPNMSCSSPGCQPATACARPFQRRPHRGRDALGEIHLRQRNRGAGQ